MSYLASGPDARTAGADCYAEFSPYPSPWRENANLRAQLWLGSPSTCWAGLRRAVRVSRESGRGGIRTPETGLTRLTVFKTAAFNRSATLPRHSDPTRSGGGSLQALNLASVRSRRGGRAAEGTRLLSEYGGKPPSRVRIPPSPLRPGSGSWWLHRTVPRRRGDSRVSGISMGATCDFTPPESSPTSASTTA